MDSIQARYADIKMLEQETLFQHFLCSLSTERQQKILALRTEAGRRQSLGAWVLFDGLLYRFYGLREREVRIAYGAHGKPYVADTGGGTVHFNLSHSEHAVLAALAPVQIGCDIQKNVDGERMARVAARFFTLDEQQALADGWSFAKLWARKESWIKCDGMGMAQDLRSFSVVADSVSAEKQAKVSQQGADAPCMERDVKAGRRFADKHLDGYEIAICYMAPEEYPVCISQSGLFFG